MEETSLNGIAKHKKLFASYFLQRLGVQCAEIGQVENANPVVLTGRDGNKNILGTQATFTCKANYAMVGDAVRTCQQDGAWSGVQPRCIGMF